MPLKLNTNLLDIKLESLGLFYQEERDNILVEIKGMLLNKNEN